MFRFQEDPDMLNFLTQSPVEGKKHLEGSLITANKQGYETFLIFLIQIEKCKTFLE